MREIIIATGTLGEGGAERVFMNLANEMARRDVQVRVLVTGTRPVKEYPLSEKVIVDTVVSTKANKILKVLEKLGKFRRYFRAHEGAAVISFFPDVSAYCVLASAGLRNRNIVSERNDPHTIPRKFYMRRIRNLAFRFADVCVFQTEDARHYFPACVQKKGVLIANPVQSRSMPAPRAVSEREPLILAVGRIVPQKNFPLLVRAFASIENRYPAYRLEIYGDQTHRDGIFTLELSALIRELGLEGRVLLMGFSDDIYSVMNRAALYVSSSDFEGMSNTMLEAMAMGVPSVVTDCPIGGARMVVRDGENGRLVPVGDVRRLAAAMEELLSDSALRERISAQAVRVRETMDSAKICDEWLRLIP